MKIEKIKLKKIIGTILMFTLLIVQVPISVEAVTSNMSAMNSVPTVNIVESSGYALKTDGTLWAWGVDWAYAEKSKTVTGINIEGTPYETNNKYVHIVKNYRLTSNGELYAWGDAIDSNPKASDAVKVADNIAMIDNQATYPNNCIVLTKDGDLVKWTYDINEEGRLSKPVFTRAPEILMSDVVSHYTDGASQYVWRALKADGTLWACDNKGDIKKEMDNVVAFSSGEGHYATTLAIKKDGSLWGWGANTYGQVGNKAAYTRSERGGLAEELKYFQDTPVKILENVIFAEANYTSFAITNDGTLYGWGRNQDNELGFTGGNHIYDTGYSKTNCQTIPKVITSNVASVEAKFGTTFVLKKDGSLWSCGNNGNGEAGQSTKSFSYPTLTKFMDGVKLPAGITAEVQVQVEPKPIASPINEVVHTQTDGSKFIDVPQSHWSYKAVESASEKGFVSGTGNGLYAPSRSVSNIEWFVMITNAFKLSNFEPAPPKYSLPEDWWYDSAKYAYKSNWLGGTTIDAVTSWSNGTDFRDFMPKAVRESAINRYDMAQTIYNMVKSDTFEDQNWTLDNVDTAGISSKIADYSKIPDKYKPAVEFCYSAGFIAGVDSKGTFDGTALITRSSAATVLMGLYTVKEGTWKSMT